MRKKKYRADHRADARGGPWIGFPLVVFESAAHRSLTPFERAVLMEILARMRGYNNGKIAISHREIAARLGNSNFTKISRAIAVLIERGLLDISAEGVWKERRAREYRLTFVSSGSPPFIHAATNEYLTWKHDADTPSAEWALPADGVSANRSLAADAESASILKLPRKSVRT